MSEAKIKQEGLHLRFNDQLARMSRKMSGKISRVQKDLNSFILFPDARREEAYISLVEAGEIEPVPDGATSLSVSTIGRVESEYQDRLKFYQDKVDRLKMLVELIAEEQELRADKKVVRSPIGSTYYVDFDNGNDVDNDGSSAVKTNGDGPWATLDKAAATLTAGDKVIVRRGMTQVVTQDLAFTNDGNIVSPIVVEADYDNVWGDEVTAGETATLTFGSKTVTFAGDISASIAAHKWIYVSGEDNRVFAYEVESVSGGSNEIVTLYLPYKGAQAGSGKTIKVMLYNPIWNTTAGNFEVNIDVDNYWAFQGLHFRGTDSNGVVELDDAGVTLFKDCILEGNGGSDYSLKATDGGNLAILTKCRFYNYVQALKDGGPGHLYGLAYDCLFDGNSISGSSALGAQESTHAKFYDCEMKNHTGGDFEATPAAHFHGQVWGRNCLLGSATEVDRHEQSFPDTFYFEDYDQVVGDNRQLTGFSVAEGTPSIQSEATKVRAGGGTTSIKCTPSDKLSTIWEFSKVKLFEYPIYLVKDVEKTFTVYFLEDDHTDWIANPSATELWIEVEYWGHATNAIRKLTKSTGTVDFAGGNDATWHTLTVTVTPLQTGVLYLRGYYCKTKEDGKSNIFYCDTKIGIA